MHALNNRNNHFSQPCQLINRGVRLIQAFFPVNMETKFWDFGVLVVNTGLTVCVCFGGFTLACVFLACTYVISCHIILKRQSISFKSYRRKSIRRF